MGLFTQTRRPAPRSPQPSIKGVFDRSPDAARALRDYRSVNTGSDLVVAKVVRRHRGIEQHLGYRIVPSGQMNRFGEVSG